MRIAVNTRLLLSHKLEGIGWYSYEILSRMVRNHPETEFFFLFDRPYDPKFIFAENVTPVVIGPPARHPFLFVWWFNYSVKKALKKIQPDLFVSPDGYLSLTTTIPQLAVIHDLNFEHYPEDLPWLVRKYYRYYFPRFAQAAKRIVTVSEFSKKDIVQRYHVPSEKVSAIWNGTNSAFHPLSTLKRKEAQERFTRGKEYFIFVSALHPRKNPARLFKAFDLYKERTSKDTVLLIVGEKYHWPAELEQTYQNMRFKNDVIFTGHLPIEDLNLALNGALALTYVSYFEGFGLPIVEAFRCEVPVITSNCTSLPEVAGDAAILVDPFNTESIADAMVKIGSDENGSLKADLVEKGKKRVDLFSWDVAADKLWEEIQKTVKC